MAESTTTLRVKAMLGSLPGDFENLHRGMKKSQKAANEFGNALSGMSADMGMAGKALGALAQGLASGTAWGMAAAGIVLVVDHFKAMKKEAEETAKKVTQVFEDSANAIFKLQAQVRGLDPEKEILKGKIAGIDSFLSRLEQRKKEWDKLNEEIAAGDFSKIGERDALTTLIKNMEEEVKSGRLVALRKTLQDQLGGMNDLEQKKKTEEEEKVAAKVRETNTALQGQIDVLRQMNEVDAAVAQRAADYALIQVQVKNGTLDATTAVLQKQLADEKYLQTLTKINAEEEKKKRAQEIDAFFTLNKQNEAQSFDAGNFPGLGDEQNQQASMVEKSRIHSLQEAGRQTQAIWGAVGESVTTAFSALGQAIGGTAGEIVSQIATIIVQVLALIVALATSDALMTGPAGLFAAVPMAAAILASVIGLIAGISSPTPGRKASGGNVWAGSPYIVGEMGPELFIPDTPGSITPNNALGGGAAMNITINAAALDRSWWIANQENILKTISNAARNRRTVV